MERMREIFRAGGARLSQHYDFRWRSHKSRQRRDTASMIPKSPVYALPHTFNVNCLLKLSNKIS